MTPRLRMLAWLATAGVAITGVVYFWMKYLLEAADEFAVVHHPLQPVMLKLHILLAPLLVFILGCVAAAHVARHLATGTRSGRRSGLGAVALAVLMVASGYAVQVLTDERAVRWTGWAHTAAGLLFASMFMLHQRATRTSRAARLSIAAGLLVLALVLAAARAHGATTPVTIERAWPVMGTVLSARVSAPDPVRAEAALEAARERVFLVDSLMSTYRAESELAELNRRAGTGRPLVLSAHTATVLECALEVGRESAGAFDVTVGPLVACWDFFRDHQGEEVPPPSPEAIAAARALTGQRRIVYDRATRAASLPLPGMSIDLGAIAKGYALDVAAGAARSRGATAGLVDLGGQVLCFGSPLDGAGSWRLAVRDPRDAEAAAAVIGIDAGSLATSGDYERFTTWRGRRHASIIDPRTGHPVEGTAAVTVHAPTAMLADAWSTALFVLDAAAREAALAWHPELGALWFDDPGEGPLTGAHLHVAGAIAPRVERLIP